MNGIAEKFKRFIGYDQDLDIKDKYTYILVGVSNLMIISFIIFYNFMFSDLMFNIHSLLNLLLFVSSFVLLKKKKFFLAKIILFGAFMIQETMTAFYWFPLETNLHLYYFVIPPGAYILFNMNIRREKAAIIVFNITATLLLLLSIMVDHDPKFDLSANTITAVKLFTVPSTIFSVILVYYILSRSLVSTNRRLSYMANTDSLTDISNRRYFFQNGRELLESRRKSDRNFSLLVFDIDNFKKINDTYGHPVGDRILIKLTELISSAIRKEDIFARIGGEEFALIYRNTPKEGGIRIAENIRRLVEEYDFKCSNGLTIKITISIGVTHNTDCMGDFNALVLDADRALYRAKAGGKNRIEPGTPCDII